MNSTLLDRPAIRRTTRRSVREVIRPLEELARQSDRLFTTHTSFTGSFGARIPLPRFLFAGPNSGNASFLRLGIFAGIHGDEDAGVLGAVRFLEKLDASPDIADGYEIFVYPVCNPTGYALGTRESRAGLDLNREFWRDSSEPEVILLERQLRNLAFDGIISLHADDTSEGIYGFVRGHALTRHVLEPALQKAEAILPRNYDRSIDNFQANLGIIEVCHPGILTAPESQHPQPLEIIFETPGHASMEKQVDAQCLALEAVLLNFRAVMAQAQNI